MRPSSYSDSHQTVTSSAAFSMTEYVTSINPTTGSWSCVPKQCISVVNAFRLHAANVQEAVRCDTSQQWLLLTVRRRSTRRS